MARDRQRSKGRRKRPRGNPAAGRAGKSSRAREIGLDDAGIEQSGLSDAAQAPDPLENASPGVERAEAEDAASRGEPGEAVDFGGDDIFEGEDNLDRAPDELESDLLPSSSGRVDPAIAEERAARPHKERGRLLTFLRHCVDELRRVQWPDRKHVGQATAVVLGFVLVAGGYLGLMDAIWQPVINAIL